VIQVYHIINNYITKLKMYLYFKFRKYNILRDISFVLNPAFPITPAGVPSKQMAQYQLL